MRSTASSIEQPVKPLHIAISLVLAFSGCAKKETQGECTPVGSAQQIDQLKTATPANPVLDDQRLAIDCIIMTARQYAGVSDVSSVVAKAVVTACHDQISTVSGDLFKATLGDAGSGDPVAFAQSEADQSDKDMADAALRYVVEARAGHCPVSRPKWLSGELPKS